MNILRHLPGFESRPELLQRAGVELRTANPLHFKQSGETKAAAEGQRAELGTFGNMVLSALGETSNQILDSQLLQQQAIVSPDSVDPSTLVVSMLKADMSLSLTKAVIDRATAAYKELTTVR